MNELFLYSMHLKITCIILLIPSITTITVFQSLLSSKLQNGLRTPFWTIVVNCCTEPPDVKFVTAHAASFWDLKSPYQRNTEQILLNVKNEHLETSEIMHIIEIPDLCLHPTTNANHYSYTLINVLLQIPPTCTM